MQVGFIEIEDEKPLEQKVYLPAPRPQLFVGVFPRLQADDGTWLGSFDDDAGVEQPWYEHVLYITMSTSARPDISSGNRRGVPQFQQPLLGPGTMTLRWTRPSDAEFFELSCYRGSTDSHHTVRPPATQQILYRTKAGESISARVRSGFTNFVGVDKWGESSSIRTAVPAEHAYQSLQVAEVQAISGVVRHTDTSVLVAGDGQAQSLTYSGSEGWHVWHPITDGPKLEPLQPVALISRSPNYMDAFTVINSQVHLAWWGKGVWHRWQPMSEAWLPPHAAVGACTRNSDFMDVFAVDKDGTMRGSWWNGNPWRDWGPLDGATFPPGAPIAAACRNDDVSEIWAIDMDGDMRGRHWNGQWNDWFNLAGPKFPPGGHIAAVANGGEMRVAAVDIDGIVQEIAWRGNWGTWEPRPGVASEPGQPLALAPLFHLWLVDNSDHLCRWRPATQDWLVEREEGFRFWKPLAAYGRRVAAFSKEEASPGLHVGTIDDVSPESPCSWWEDADS
ncbi:MAG TPA: hypothetical protein VMF51_24640 [Nocardioides sp.]|uniref:hypothetical protein n=1 Tax=Nocardioides sp. TaxID=35761 RepID=UPI002B667E60|nr:hypothetical protein [Nocardioides sp.]HTW18335.1 hypothetical protein [Nocardioides sp.]